MLKTQKCFRCGDVRPVTMFAPHPSSASGYRKVCKDCVLLYNKKSGPKPTKMDIPSEKRDQLAYHPNQTATLTPYYKKIIGGSYTPRDPGLTPSRTLLWSENAYWQEKPIYARQTGNKEIRSRGV